MNFATTKEAITEGKRLLTTLPKGWKVCTITGFRGTEKRYNPSFRKPIAKTTDIANSNIYILYVDGWYCPHPTIKERLTYNTPLAALKAFKKHLTQTQKDLTKILKHL